MINVSKEFKEKIEYGRFLLYLTITLADGTVLNLDDSNIWEGGFKIDEGVTESGEFTIGSCIINKMTVVLHDEDEKLSRQVFDGAQVIPYVGIELDNGSIEKIPKGVYEVDSTSYDGDLITLECLDNMHKLDKEYAGVTTTYPATIQTIVTDLCTYCGVVLQSARFDGYNVKLTKRPTNSGITCRQVLSYAMQMICKFAKCDANGKLIIDWFNQQVFEQNALLDGGIFDDDSPYSSGDEADGGTFSPWNTGYEHSSGTFEDMDAFHHIYTLDTLDVAVEDVIISGVQVTAETEDTENGDTFFYGEEGYVLKISGNPFITKENAANFAEYLGKKLIGLIFRPLDASTLPDPTVEAGDIAYISDGPSKSYSALVTNLSFDPDDNMSISCDAESPKKTESQRPTELEQTLAKMRKETENTLSAYDIVVQQMSQLAANTLGFHETKIIQDDGSVIVYRHDKPKLSESKIVYKSGIDGFFVTRSYTGKDSTTAWKAGFDSNGNAALNILSVIGIYWDWGYGGTLTLGGEDNKNGVLRILNENGAQIGKWDNTGADITGTVKTIANKDIYVKITGYDIDFIKSDDSGERSIMMLDSSPSDAYNDQAEIIIGEKADFFISGDYWAMLQMYPRDDHTVKILGNFEVMSGTKSRVAETQNFSDRLLYCYETPTPMFGDVGCAQTNAEGVAIIDIDPVFAETISTGTEYQVFLQKEGPGDLWIQEKDESYFVVRGTPELKFSWELKCSQKHFEHLRLEEETQRTMVSKDINNAENDYSDIIDGLVNDYDTEMEELINESN